MYVSVLQRRHNGEVCVFASNLFVLCWVRMRQVCLGSVSSVVFIGGGGLFCCVVTMVVCIVVKLVFMSCSIMVSVFLLMLVVYLVLLNVFF